MTASTKCKKAGLKNFNELVELSNESASTLQDWFKDRPLRFNLILLGCVLSKVIKELNEGEVK